MKKKNALALFLIVSLLLTGCSSTYYDEGQHDNSYNDSAWDYNEERDSNDYSDTEDTNNAADDADSNNEQVEDDDVWADADGNPFWEDDDETDSSIEDSTTSYKDIEYWGFCNSDLYNGFDYDGYYLLNDDYERLTANITPGEKTLLDWYVETDANRESHDCYWDGSCYGMAITAVRSNNNKEPFELIGNNKLQDFTKTNKKLISFINYYWLQQFLTSASQAEQEFMSWPEKKKVTKLKALAQAGIPFVLCFYTLNENGISVGGHAVVGYDLEESSQGWGYEDWGYIDYNYKLIVYDNNAPGSTNEYDAIYFNDDGSWCYPAYSSFCTPGSDGYSPLNQSTLCDIMVNDDYLNIIDFETGELSSAYATGNADDMVILHFGDGEYEMSSVSGKISIKNGVIKNTTYKRKDCFCVPVFGSENGRYRCYLPSGDPVYTVKTIENQNIALESGNCVIIAKADAPGTLEFTNTGEIKTVFNKNASQSQITITTNGNNPYSVDDCNTVEIEQKNTLGMNITPSSSGVIIDSNALNTTTVSVDVFEQKEDLKTNLSGSSVLFSKNGNTLEIKADSNNDGNFDKVLGNEDLSKIGPSLRLRNKSVTYSGKAQKIGKATGKSVNKITYSYYKEKACKNKISAPKNAGIYYVKALGKDSSGKKVSSNIAKLSIKKAAQKITTKSKTYTIDRGKTAKLVFSSQSKKMSYKKLSGTNGINISSSGKVTVKNTLKKGSYTVKIKAIAKANKNYKQAEKNFKIKFIIS